MTAPSKRDDPVAFTNEFIRGTVPGIYDGFGIRIVELESGRAVRHGADRDQRQSSRHV